MERNIRVLVACNEPLVVDALRILVGTAAQGGRAFQFTTISHCDEFIQQARSGEFDLAIMHVNCLVPARPLTLIEHVVLAIESIQTSCLLPLIVLTTMEDWVKPLRDSGAVVCLQAPVDANELVGAISTLI